MGKELHQDEAGEGDATRHQHGQVQHAAHAPVFAQAQVITGNRLHALGDAQHHHHEHEHNAVHHAVGPHTGGADVLHEEHVEEDHHPAGHKVQQARGQADRQDAAHDAAVQFPHVASAEVQHVLSVAEVDEHPHQTHRLRGDGGGSGSRHAPAQYLDVDGGHGHIHRHRDQ